MSASLKFLYARVGSLFVMKIISFSLYFIFTFAVNVMSIRVLNAHCRILLYHFSLIKPGFDLERKSFLL